MRVWRSLWLDGTDFHSRVGTQVEDARDGDAVAHLEAGDDLDVVLLAVAGLDGGEAGLAALDDIDAFEAGVGHDGVGGDEEGAGGGAGIDIDLGESAGGDGSGVGDAGADLEAAALHAELGLDGADGAAQGVGQAFDAHLDAAADLDEAGEVFRDVEIDLEGVGLLDGGDDVGRGDVGAIADIAQAEHTREGRGDEGFAELGLGKGHVGLDAGDLGLRLVVLLLVDALDGEELGEAVAGGFGELELGAVALELGLEVVVEEAGDDGARAHLRALVDIELDQAAGDLGAELGIFTRDDGAVDLGGLLHVGGLDHDDIDLGGRRGLGGAAGACGRSGVLLGTARDQPQRRHSSEYDASPACGLRLRGKGKSPPRFHVVKVARKVGKWKGAREFMCWDMG
jgi:hypothetical protein